MLRAAFILGIALAFTPTSVFGFDYGCSYRDSLWALGQREMPYPYDDGALRAKLVFVGFPSSTTVSFEQHAIYLSLMREYIEKQSYGKLLFDEDTDILLPPGEILDENHSTANTWVAQFESGVYQNDSRPVGWDYHHLAPWFRVSPNDSTSFGLKALFAEILWKIYQAYLGTEVFTDPQGAAGWELFVIFVKATGHSGPTPVGVGGSAPILVHAATVVEDTEPFYNYLRITSSDKFAGCYLVGNAVGDIPDGQDPSSIVYYLLHEYAHTLGPLDGPPDLNESSGESIEWKYFYGNLNLLSQHWPPLDICHGAGYTKFSGFPPIGDHWLATLPWNAPSPGESSVIDFTGRCLFDQKVYDVSTGGQLYRVDVGPFDSGRESFLIAYHGGNGVESIGGQSVLRCQGLAIWHCISPDNLYQIVDLEVATGLWDYPGLQVEVYLDPWEIENLAPDNVSGYDGYDGWVIDPVTDWERNHADFCSYMGGAGDFFRIDPDPNYNNRVFDYASNPNCYGYSRDPSPPPDVRRRRPQDVPNSLIVKIKGEGVEDEPDGRQYLIVDLLFAPAERLVDEEDLIDSVTVNSQIDLPLTAVYADSIRAYTVRYSNNSGQDWDEWTVAENVPYDPNNPVFSWTPTPDQWSPSGKLRFEYTSTLTSQIDRYDAVGYYETPDFCFTGTGTPTIYEVIVTPNGGETLYEYIPAEIQWTNHWQNQFQIDIDQVRVDYDLNEDEVWRPWVEFSPQDWVYDPVAEVNVAEAVPLSEMIGPQVRVRLTFVVGLNEASKISDNTFQVYPTPVKYENEEGDPSSPNYHGVDYQGRPYSTAVFDYDDDAKRDVLITMESSPSPQDPGFNLYRNVKDPFQPNLRFQDQTLDRFQNSEQFGPGFRGLAVAAHDSPSNIEIFMAHPTAPAYFKRNPSTGRWYNVIGDQDEFDPDELELAAQSYCAAWADLDRDGNLDLYVGRGSMVGDSLSPLRDAVFLQRRAAGMPRFEEAGQEVGLVSESAGFLHTRSVAIADYDENGFLDVMVGGGGNLSLIQYYKEADECFGFAKQANPPAHPGNTVTVFKQPVHFLEWLDVDRDGDLDLVSVGGRFVCVFEHNGTTYEETPIVVELDEVPTGGMSADLDLDGWPDTILFSGATESPSTILLNRSDRASFTLPFLVTDAAAFGLGDANGAFGLSIADFDGDGDPDLIMGLTDLEDHTGRVKRAKLPQGGEGPAHNWLGIRLDGQVEDSPLGLGARVSLSTTADLPLGTQIVSGGGGRGGQASPIRIFGLGDYGGSVRVAVQWPLGFLQEFEVGFGCLNSVITVVQSVGCTLDEDSVDLTINYEPDGSLEWVFTWETDRWTKTSEDEVVVSYVSGKNCVLKSSVTLEYGADPDIEVKPVRYLATGNYFHEVHWKNQPCTDFLSCRYSFFVRSWDGRFAGTEVSSGQHEVYFPVCPAMQ